jgi:hypothetical protein
MRVKATAPGRARRSGGFVAAGAMAVPGVRGRAAVAAGALGALAVLLAGCGGSGPASAVPSLSQSASAANAAGTSTAAKLHAAARCIRQHGIPGYQDPVLTPGGAVYSDARSFQNAPASTLSAVQAACRTLMVEAGLGSPENEPPAPPQLVQAGVRAAECERAHGLPNVQDPTANSTYTPGHGFGLTGNEVPAGGKASHGFQEASHACHSQVDAELRASTLSSLGSDG